MKDYTFKKVKDFILNYEVIDNKIIINYASGKKYENLYTKELEKDILKKMKEQVIKYGVKMEEKKSKKVFNNIINLIISFILVFFTLEILNFGIFTWLVGILLWEVTYALPKFIRDSKITDYEKNKFFIDNMELFQNGIKEEMGIYKNLDKESKAVIKNVLDNKYNQEDDNIKYFNINYIDKITYKSLKNIHELLEKNEEFSKYYNTEKTTSKKKVLSRDN